MLITMKQYLRENYKLNMPAKPSKFWLHDYRLPAFVKCSSCGKMVRLEAGCVGAGSRAYCKECADEAGGVTCW